MIGLSVALILGYIQMKYHILSISEDIYFMDYLPLAFNVKNTIFIVVAAIISSIIASYWPAKIAANIKPANAVRYE